MGAPWCGPYRTPGRKPDEDEPTVDGLIDKLEGLKWVRKGSYACSCTPAEKYFRIDGDGWLWFDGKQIETTPPQKSRLQIIFRSTHNELLAEAHRAADLVK